VNDKRLIAAAKDAVCVLVRRPHAYKFRAEHPGTPIPGLVVLDAEGKVKGAVALSATDAVEKMVELLVR